ncbi:MAG: single-stranded DNA-binding protein [Sulfurovum sp.]|nr:single-stranded DNA-binding protein [Sulfurovum sp.]
MYNKIILAGNLTRDIEIKYTQSGTAIGNTAIATSRKFKSQMGEQKEEVLFVDITFFGRTAEVANQYLRKGSKVLVDGRLKLDQWTAQDGSKRSKHSVTVESLQMLDNKGTNPADAQMGNNGYGQEAPNTYNAPAQNAPASQNSYSQPQAQPQSQAATRQPAPMPEIDIDEDEIPF